MNQLDFLTAILPASGRYCSVGIDAKGTRQLFAESIEELAVMAERNSRAGRNAYFAMAAYDSEGTRKQANVISVKSLWLDIDCGEGKPYADQTEGVTALVSFVASVGLPPPLLVNSGRGVHAYWAFKEAVMPTVWLGMASKLKSLCAVLNLQADPAVTADIARILRVVGTINTKNGADVSIWNEGSPSDSLELDRTLSDACDANGVVPVIKQRAPKIDALTAAIAFGDKKVSFIKIAESQKCNQVNQAITSPADVDEPTWRGLLSMAKCCEEPEAIHWISQGHPDYERNRTEEKAAGTGGAYSCETFSALNGHCNTCPNKGKVKNALAFGIEYDTKEAPIVAPTTAVEKPTPIHEHTDISTLADTAVEDYRDANTIEREAAVPEGYSLMASGGVLKHGWTNPVGEDVPEKVVYENDLYLYRRVRDPNDGECLMARLVLPKDGARDFIIPMKDMGAADKLREILGRNGVASVGKDLGDIMNYLSKAAKELQKREVADDARMQMGWTPDHSVVLGELEITAKGDVHCPASPATQGVSEFIYASGDLDTWKEVWDAYAKPGFELQAFAALTGFGSMLLKYTGQTGGLINLASNSSGTGKTTSQLLANSIWGDPLGLLMVKDDKMLAKVHKIGVLNTLPACIDEITNMEPEEISDLCYGITNGKGRDRMMSSVNAIRVNRTRWCTIGLTSSNAFIRDKLAILKSTSEGEQMRILEIQIDRAGQMNKETADSTFGPIKNNFGHAGIIYSRYIVRNHKQLKSMVQQVQKQLDLEFGATNKERIWSGMAAANICGGLIAKHLGLLPNFDMKRIQSVVVDHLLGETTKVREAIPMSSDIMGEFLLDRINATLVIDEGLDKNTGVPQNTVIREPKGNMLSVRYEITSGLMFVTKKDLKQYCVNRQISFTGMVDTLRREGKYLMEVNKRMAAGTTLSVPSVTALCLRFARDEVLDAH